MKKITLIIAIIAFGILIIAGVLFTNRNGLFQDRVRDSLAALTGTDVEINGVEVGGLNAAVIKELKIMSPRGYEQKVLIEIKDIELDFDGLKYLRGEGVDFKRVSFTIAQTYLERHEKGNFNLRDLAIFSNLNASSALRGRFYIDRLEIVFEKAVLYEYIPDKEPQATEVDFVGRKEVYGKITDPAILIFAPVLKIIPEFKRGNMGIPRTELQKKLSEASGFQRS